MLHENSTPSVLSSQALPVQSLVFAPRLHPAGSLAPRVPSDIGYFLVNLHCGHDLAGNTYDVLTFFLFFQSTVGHNHLDAVPEASRGGWVYVQTYADSGRMMS